MLNFLEYSKYNYLYRTKHNIYPYGRGTQEHPFQIQTFSHLYWLSIRPKYWQYNHFKLICDINCKGKVLTNSIGSEQIQFSGIFNGNSKKIYNFTPIGQFGEEAYYGLFQIYESAVITDLTIGEV